MYICLEGSDSSAGETNVGIYIKSSLVFCVCGTVSKHRASV